MKPRNETEVPNLQTTVAARETGDELFLRLLRVVGSGRELPQLRKAAQRFPDHAGIVGLHGLALAHAGRPVEAIPHLRRASELDAANAEHRSNLGIALLRAGQIGEACRELEQACKSLLADAVTWYHLGLARLHAQRPGQAIHAFAEALRRDPILHDARLQLACASFADGDVAGARLEMQRLEPDRISAESLSEGARLLVDLLEFDRAQTWLVAMLRRKPKDADASLRLASLAERGNRTDEARTLLRSVMHAAKLPLALLVGAKLDNREGAYERSLQKLASLAESAPESMRAEACFEQARALDRLGRYAEAFERITAGNDLCIARHVKSHPEEPVEIERLEWLEQEMRIGAAFPRLDTGDGKLDPIFIVGFPRSGTTLLDQVLDAHPALQTLEEKPALETVVLQMRRDGIFDEGLASLTARAVAHYRAMYWKEVATYATLQPGRRLVDKNPLYLVRLPVILRLFPKARFLFALRDPRDVVLSCFTQHMQYTRMTQGFWSLQTTAHRYVQVMDGWARMSAALHPLVTEVRYETLVEDFENQLRRVFAFLELDWMPSVLDFQGHARSRRWINTPSYRQVTEPLYRRSVERWRHYQDPLAPILPVLAPIVERYRYAPS